MTSGVEVGPNIAAASRLIRQAAAEGATLVATPEVTGLMERRSERLFERVRGEADDAALAAFRALAAELGIWLLVGSLAVRGAGDRLANRSFLLAPDGTVAARYDKIHMFDVDLPNGETARESRNYGPGTAAVVAEMAAARLGLSICYDLRFAYLYRALAQAGAGIISVPAAFTRITGQAHWHVLLRARAIETGSFVIAPAQTGRHEDGRETFGHSLIVAPWGEVLADAGAAPGVVVADLDLAQVAEMRGRIPALRHDRPFTGP